MHISQFDYARSIAPLPMAQGFAYLVAILDLYSREVLSFRVSNAMSTEFCVEAPEDALARYGARRDLQHRPGQPVHR